MYYIDPINGLDTNAGTSAASPVKTIAKLNTFTYVAGGGIRVKKGTYPSDATITLNGSAGGAAGNPITITGYDPSSGNDSTGAGLAPTAGSAVVLTNCPYVEIFGLKITGANPSPTSTASPNYQNVQPAGISVLNTTGNATQIAGIVVRDNEISGFVSGVTFYATVAGQTGGFTNPVVENNHIHDCPAFGVQLWSDDTAVIQRHHNASVRNNHIHHIAGYAVNGNGSGTGIVPGMCTNEIVANNWIHDCGYSDTHTSGGGPCAICVVYSSGPGLYQDNDIDWVWSNTAAAVDGTGIDLDMGVSGKTVQYNRITNCGGAGLYSYLEGNNNVVRYNETTNNDRQGGSGAEFKLNGSGTGHEVYGNTIRNWLGNSSHGMLVQGGGGHKILNNDIQVHGSSGVFVLAVNPGTTVAGNNYWDTNQASPLYDYNGTSYTGLAAFRAASGQETGTGGEGDPVLRDHSVIAPKIPRRRAIAACPVWNSPLVGAGVDLSAYAIADPGTRDLNGNPLPSGRQTVGAVAVPDRPSIFDYVANVKASGAVYYNRLNAAGTSQPATIGTAAITLPADATAGQPGPLALDNTSGSVKFSGTDTTASAATLAIDLSSYVRVAIEFWYYHPGGSPDRLFESEGNWANHAGDLLLQVGTIGWNSGTFKYATMPAVTPNAWNHVVVFYDLEAPVPSTQMRAMINGKMYALAYQGGATSQNNFFSTQPLDLMMGNAGRLSEFAIYADVLPPTGSFAERYWLATWSGALPAAADIRGGKQTGQGSLGTLVVPTSSPNAIAVNHNTGGTDNLRYLYGTSPVGGGLIVAYLASDYSSGNVANPQGESTTGADGRWLTPIMLQSGYTYVLAFSKQAVYEVSTASVTV